MTIRPDERSAGIAGVSQPRRLPTDEDRQINEHHNQPGERREGGGGTTVNDPEGLLGLYPYSGADVKLVVHMPPRETPAEANGNRAELERQLADLDERIQAVEPHAEDVTQAEARVAELNREIDENVRAAEQAIEVPDPIMVSFYESQVTSLQEEADELETTIRNARVSGAIRDRLVEERATTVAQLEALGGDEAQPSIVRPIKTLAELQTLSISTHREKYPVRTLGSVFPRSYTRGPRTLSGSMVFAVFNQHVFKEFLESAQYASTGVGDYDRFGWRAFLPDQLPPLDISIALANEYGNISYASILGVEFINEGMVLSIEDLYVESTMQWVARDYDPLRAVGARTITSSGGVGRNLSTFSGTSLLMQELRSRSAGRRNPFL